MKLYGVKREESRRLFVGGEVTVAVYGLGKMGLPLAAVFADSGASVVGVDINGDVVDSVNDGLNHVREEPGLDELVSVNVGGGRLRATSDFVGAAKESDIQVILVPTLIRDKKADLSPVYSVAECISAGLERGDIVVTECTMPPGSTESLIPVLEKSGLEAGVDFGLGHCPERTMSGTAIRDIRGQYPKVIGCVDGGTTGALEGVYSAVNSKGVVSVSGVRAAECVKVFEGVYRDVNIALANELTGVCERLGVSAVEVFRVANTQPYCSLHSPGGVGGHCIPFYPYFVMDDETELIRLSRGVNDSIPEKLVNKAVKALEEAGREIKGANVLVLGISFRGGVKEVIKSPAVDVLSLLKGVGANVFCFDPLFSRQEIEAYGVNYRDDYKGIDCIIIAADHVEFKDLDWGEIGGVMRTKVVVDFRQIVDPVSLRDLGFICYGLGFV